MKVQSQRCEIHIILLLIFFIIMGFLSCNQGDARRDENNSLMGEVNSSDQVKIDYRVNGTESDTALVFIHEWLCNQTYWENQIQYFSTSHRVVTLDLAGHGRSGDDRKQYTLDLYADDVMAVIKKIKARKVYLIGHSLGASVAVKVALKMPGKVIAIIAVDAFQNLTQDFPEGNIDNMIGPYRRDFPTAVRKHASLLFGENPDTLLVKKVMNDWSSADSSMAIATMIDNLHFKPSEWTQQLKVPVYGLNAAKFPANAEGNKKMLKHYQMFTLPRVGHFPQLEDPGYFNEVLKTVLREASKNS